MEFISPNQHFTSDASRRGLFKDEPFCVIDVGCSGGIAPVWRVFEPDLRAIGIDPVIEECTRLSAKETNPAVRYLPAFVGLPDEHPFNQARKGQPPTQQNPWARLSSASGSEILARRVQQEKKLPVLNTWQNERLAEVKKFTLDELAASENLPTVDFIKIDIDGHDLEALHSAEHVIRTCPVLGLVLEINYYGGVDPTEHTFHNTDRLMRGWGFDLFGITSRRYSAAAMPNRFEWDCPAQAISGRPYQGDALYLRDAIGLEDGRQTLALSPSKLLKLACLFESFCLPDFAVELVLRHADTMGVELEFSLDLLARGVRNDGISFREHIRRFNDDPTRFYRDGTM